MGSASIIAHVLGEQRLRRRQDGRREIPTTLTAEVRKHPDSRTFGVCDGYWTEVDGMIGSSRAFCRGCRDTRTPLLDIYNTATRNNVTRRSGAAKAVLE